MIAMLLPLMMHKAILGCLKIIYYFIYRQARFATDISGFIELNIYKLPPMARISYDRKVDRGRLVSRSSPRCPLLAHRPAISYAGHKYFLCDYHYTMP